jgi:hypothetical protein
MAGTRKADAVHLKMRESARIGGNLDGIQPRSSRRTKPGQVPAEMDRST